MEALVRRTEGRSAGYIASLVNRAAQHALHRALAAPGDAVIVGEDVKAALDERVGVVGTRQEQRLTWDDLVLPDETRRRLVVLQSMVENPQRAAALGVRKMPRGAILFGPPRTARRRSPKVFASQTSCRFFALSGTELTSKWLGETEKKIRNLFRAAREARPAIVFIDEIDSIAAPRGEDGSSRGYDAALNQLLTELDGFQTTEGVFVIGATNRFDPFTPRS